jgi:hypothetical protein
MRKSAALIALVISLKKVTILSRARPEVGVSSLPETLLGRPVIEAVDMPDVGSGTFPIAFGDWSTAFRVFDKPSGFSVLRDPYSVATKGLVRFCWLRRTSKGRSSKGGSRRECSWKSFPGPYQAIGRRSVEFFQGPLSKRT